MEVAEQQINRPDEDDTPPGQGDPDTDNGRSQDGFFEVGGQEEMQKDERAYNELGDCSESIHDLGGAIKRADAVSPQVADGVDKVMLDDHTLVENQEQWKKAYDKSDDHHLHDDTGYPDDGREDSSSPITSPFDDSLHRNNTSYVSDGSSFDTDSINLVPNKEGIFFCHLCSFSGRNQGEFEEHMTCHFEHTCPHCDYKSRTEGRLKRHIKDFHTEDPPEGFGTKRNMGRPKVFRCKQCDFSAIEKEEFWSHARSHIKDDKILQCPRCPFVTEYKHHLEYHLRNHFGSKPFKCNKCNYSCVNKSMLNSHMKSHTNVYQYRCADCTYATKYCHSLKLHLRKYTHKPATVLNSDGSLPQGIDAEASGLSLMQKRGPPRGPRGPRKDKFDPFVSQFLTMPHPGLPGMSPGMNSGMMSPYWPILNQFPPNGLHAPPPLVPVSMNSQLGSMPQDFAQQHIGLPPAPNMSLSPGGPKRSPNSLYKCKFCSFASDVKNDLLRHVMKVHATENRDLFSIIGISPEVFLEDRFKLSQKFASKHAQDGNFPALNIKREPSPEMRSGTRAWSSEYPVDASPVKAKYVHSPNGGFSGLSKMSYDAYKNGISSPSKGSDPQAGEDIIRQMMDKFGSGLPLTSPRINRDSAPLDLTKPRSLSTSPTMATGYGHQSHDLKMLHVDKGHEMAMSTEMYEHELLRKRPSDEIPSAGSDDTFENEPPKKRSRKGKAFKLDTICMKLQEKQEDSDIEETYSGSDEFAENDSIRRRDDSDTGALDVGSDEDQNEARPQDVEVSIHAEDFEAVHKNLAILNNGKCNEVQEEEKMQPEKNGSIQNGEEEKIVNEDIDIEGRKSRDGNGKSYDTSRMNLNIKQALDMAQIKQKETGRLREMEMTRNFWNQSNLPYHMPLGQNGHSLLNTPDLSALKRQFSADHIHGPLNSSTPKSKRAGVIGCDKYECAYCEIAFRNCVMYTMHMGYHGYRDPFKCNMCGLTCSDNVDFFLHIARVAHN